MSGSFFLGVDGGGTGCRARLEDAQGRVLGAGVSGPATTRLGVEAAMASVAVAINAALAEAGVGPEPAHVAIGIAGLGRKGAHEALLALPHPYASIRFVTDGLIACIGAHGGLDGGIVIVGTGSFGLARVEGREIRVGGYGFPISDEGSGADLGLRATDYATFAPLVMRHADQGDGVGRRIVQDAAEQIDGLARALMGQGAPRIALIGGLASAIEPWLAPDVRRRVTPVEGDPIAGALHLARGGCVIPPSSRTNHSRPQG